MMLILFVQCYVNIVGVKNGKVNSVVCFYKTNHIRSYKIDHYFEQLDPYDYETIEIVLKVIQNADEKNTSIQLNQVCPDMLLLLY